MDEQGDPQLERLAVLRSNKAKNQGKKGITEVATFVIRVYLKAWMEAPLAACAPNNDLHLPKTLVKYENINKIISKAASTKLISLMCYLSEELVGLALFDRNVSNQ